MTRINVVPVTELCDQHLFAEFRELTRIPNGLVSGKLKPYYVDRPREYTLGAGHVKFFTVKVEYLSKRYRQLYNELILRKYHVTFIWPVEHIWQTVIYNDYQPDQKAIDLNRARILERMPKAARWTNRTKPDWI